MSIMTVLNGLLDVVLHAALIGLASMMIGWRRSDIATLPAAMRALCWGGAFGALAVIVMLHPTEPFPGLKIDVRAAMIATATLFGGLAAGGITTLVVFVARLAIGGAFAAVGLIGITLAFLVAALFQRFGVRRLGASVKAMLALGAAVGAVGPLASYFTFDPAMATRLVLAGGPPQVFGCILALLIATSIIRYADGARRTEQELAENYKQLAELAVKLERRNDEYYAALKEADRLNRVKSDFLANMSHELRTPLNAIIGFSETMRLQLLGPIANAKYLDYAGDIWSSGKHLLGIVDGLLDMSRIEAGRMPLSIEALDPAAEMKAVFPLLPDRGLRKRPIALKGLEIPIRLHADRQAFRQTMVNLVANALKHTAEDQPVWVAFRDCGDAVEVEVGDHGKGMSPEEVEAAGQRFGRVRNSQIARVGSGHGLGLPISRSLVELHGGTFTIESQKGVGTRVFCRYPNSVELPRAA